MHFFVTNKDYEAPSDAHDTLEAAAEYAAGAILRRELDTAIVIGMEAAAFARNIPAYICLVITAGPNLDGVR